MKMYQKQKPKQLRGENERERESTGSVKAGEIGEWKGERASGVCEIKSGLMKGRVRRVGGKSTERESGGEVCMGKECWVGKEGRHAGLCAKSKERGEMERLGGREVMSWLYAHRGGTGGAGTCPKAPSSPVQGHI